MVVMLKSQTGTRGNTLSKHRQLPTYLTLTPYRAHCPLYTYFNRVASYKHPQGHNPLHCTSHEIASMLSVLGHNCTSCWIASKKVFLGTITLYCTFCGIASKYGHGMYLMTSKATCIPKCICV